MTDDDLRHDDERKKTICVTAYNEWMHRHQKDMYPVHDIIAASFNCYTFEFVPRCWVCRSLTPFDRILRQPRHGQVWLSPRARMSEQSQVTVSFVPGISRKGKLKKMRALRGASRAQQETGICSIQEEVALLSGIWMHMWSVLCKL